MNNDNGTVTRLIRITDVYGHEIFVLQVYCRIELRGDLWSNFSFAARENCFESNFRSGKYSLVAEQKGSYDGRENRK